MILATDYPGRRVTNLGADPLIMGDRHGYLTRALRVLSTPGCDGIMGTTDFMEDLLILNALVRESGGASLMDDKVLSGCAERFTRLDLFSLSLPKRRSMMRHCAGPWRVAKRKALTRSFCCRRRWETDAWPRLA